MDVYRRATSWQRERCSGLESEIRLITPALHLRLPDIYTELLTELGLAE